MKIIILTALLIGALLLTVPPASAGICPDGERCPSFETTQPAGICPDGSRECDGFGSRGGCAHNYGRSVPIHNITANWGEWLPVGIVLGLILVSRWRGDRRR